ncbi:plasma membrane stress response protein [Aspergillus terreus]|uniref:Plasma membrane stress response protein n=1 Tax=Aspergillus terreus TaxID=33178 RepID=A0A5M3YU88_ASPTE|nr:hypothetical protein ATETN484_0004023600 [Aspergillus terreus]GFF13126.1 plasma membrane stress response protein [Aspergillus terreus]
MSLFSPYAYSDPADLDNLGVDWIIRYDFDDIDISQAIEEFRTLIHDLEEAHCQTQVRHGYGASILVCVHVPREHLGNMVHKSRVKDWLYGIAHELPIGDEYTVVESETPAEALRSVYHAVTWAKSLGGAGITPGLGKWERVTACFPLHDQLENAQLLRKMSKSMALTEEDLDTVRALFGEKVAFYYAFFHCYNRFMAFGAAWGIVSWYFFGPYSITCALVNCFWHIVFVEYWKIRQTDLSVRWNVKGVGVLKVNRPEYVWDKEVRDPIIGDVLQVFSPYRQVMRQLLLIPFATVAALALGTLIVVTFALEVFISEVYTGPWKSYLEFFPTVLFSLSLPSISSVLTTIATRMTKYENYRTQDQYDVAQTTKTFIMHFITTFLPTMLTAFVYVPFGARLMPYLQTFTVGRLAKSVDMSRLHIDPSRLQQEIIYLSITGQVMNFGEEVVLPYVKRVLRQKWRDYREKKARSRTRHYSIRTDQLLVDPPEEASFLTRIRNEAEGDEYNVHDDIIEMCEQYGYMALFGVAWPLMSVGFLINNWFEVRGDFFKLSIECQRPPPIRSDSIGPSLQGLQLLTWMGVLSTSAIVYLYRKGMEDIQLSSLLMTMLAAEWAYLAVRFAVHHGLQKIAIPMLRRESAKRYAVRKSYLETIAGSLSPKGKRRVRFQDRVSVYSSSSDSESEEFLHESKDGSPREQAFWSRPQGESVDAGVRLIKALSTSKHAVVEKKEKAS